MNVYMQRSTATVDARRSDFSQRAIPWKRTSELVCMDAKTMSENAARNLCRLLKKNNFLEPLLLTWINFISSMDM